MAEDKKEDMGPDHMRKMEKMMAEMMRPMMHRMMKEMMSGAMKSGAKTIVGSTMKKMSS
jgi:hypothetical protein